MSEVEFQHLWHRFIVQLDEPSISDDLLARSRRVTCGFAPAVTSHLALKRSNEGFIALDGVDVFATAESPSVALRHLAARVSLRAQELATLKGWIFFQGHIALSDPAAGSSQPSGRPCVVIVDDRTVSSHHRSLFLAKEGAVVPVPANPLSAGDDVPVPPPIDVTPAGVVVVVRPVPGVPRVESLPSIEAHQALVGRALRGFQAPREIVRAASALVAKAETLQLLTPRVEESHLAADSLVRDWRHR